jgi:ribokinase
MRTSVRLFPRTLVLSYYRADNESVSIFDVIVVGGLNSDFLARGSSLPRPGETKDGDTFATGPGGKGANQAVAVARLGGRVAMIGMVGDDSRGEELIQRAGAEGVDVERIRRIGRMHTGAAVIHVDDGGRKQILAVPGANHGLTADDVRDALSAMASISASVDVPSAARNFSRAVVLAQLEVRVECVEAAFRWARNAGAQTVFDPAPAIRLSDELLSLVDVIKPNSAEAEVLTGMSVSDRGSARAAARALLARGARAVAITAGDKGTLLVWKDGEHWLPRMKVKAVDATGAGDAFAGTLALYLARGCSLVDASTFANAAAALKTTKLGAQSGLPREPELREFLNRA